MTKLRYFALLIACIAVTSSSVQAQSIDARNPRTAGTTKQNALPSNASSIPLTIEPATALDDFIRGFQGEARREPLTFKPIPGERNARVAEFTTPGGLRMRAYTSGPNSIRFTPADPSLDFGGININGPGIVQTMSAGAGAKTDAIHGVLGAIRDAIGKLFGAGKLQCKTTVTVTIDENGIATTDIRTTCTKP